MYFELEADSIEEAIQEAKKRIPSGQYIHDCKVKMPQEEHIIRTGKTLEDAVLDAESFLSKSERYEEVSRKTVELIDERENNVS